MARLSICSGAGKHDAARRALDGRATRLLWRAASQRGAAPALASVGGAQALVEWLGVSRHQRSGANGGDEGTGPVQESDASARRGRQSSTGTGPMGQAGKQRGPSFFFCHISDTPTENHLSLVQGVK